MKNSKIIICSLLILFVLTGCGLARKLQINTVCPPYPYGGIGVAEELKRIPFNGWPELYNLGVDAKQWCAEGDLKSCEVGTRLDTVFEKMQPQEGFEHLYTWLNRIRRLKLQLDECT